VKTVVVGQAPSRLSDPREPLSGASGRRLAELCGCTHEQFMAAFERRNALDEWPGSAGKGDAFVGLRAARMIADRIAPELEGRRVVLLGFVLADAFGLSRAAFEFTEHRGASYAFSPHPSGASLWWNTKSNVERARAFWTKLYAERD
jgi:uracil-DNA glycosylase